MEAKCPMCQAIFECNGTKEELEQTVDCPKCGNPFVPVENEVQKGDVQSDGQESITGKASQYYEQAMAGDATSQYLLARCYENGDGVEQDYSIAIEWYQKAAAQGHQFAQNALAKVQTKLQTQVENNGIESRRNRGSANKFKSFFHANNNVPIFSKFSRGFAWFELVAAGYCLIIGIMAAFDSSNISVTTYVVRYAALFVIFVLNAIMNFGAAEVIKYIRDIAVSNQEMCQQQKTIIRLLKGRK